MKNNSIIVASILTAIILSAISFAIGVKGYKELNRVKASIVAKEVIPVPVTKKDKAIAKAATKAKAKPFKKARIDR